MVALINCKECGKQVSNTAGKCPNCGAKVPPKFSIIKAIGVIFFGLIALLFFMADKPGSSVTSAAGREATALNNLTATNLKFANGQYGTKTITGSVVNTAGKKLSYVQVELNLFDSAGTQVGSTLANVNNLESGVTWNFEAPILEGRARSVKVGGITAY